MALVPLAHEFRVVIKPDFPPWMSKLVCGVDINVSTSLQSATRSLECNGLGHCCGYGGLYGDHGGSVWGL